MYPYVLIWWIVCLCAGIWMYTDSTEIARQQERRSGDTIVSPGLWVLGGLLIGVFILPVYLSKRSSWLRMTDDEVTEDLHERARAEIQPEEESFFLD